VKIGERQAIISRRMVCLSFLVMLLFSSHAYAGQADKESVNKGSCENASTDDEVRNAKSLKEAMVSALALGLDHPRIAPSSEYQNLLEQSGDLAILFEPMQCNASLKILLSLGSYYFGEGPGSVFDCLLSEKAKQLLPLLSELTTNECESRFRNRLQHSSMIVCLDDSALRQKKKELIRSAKQGSVCNLKEFY
jgi:hypothetical protein